MFFQKNARLALATGHDAAISHAQVDGGKPNNIANRKTN